MINKKEIPQTLFAEAYVHFKPYVRKEKDQLVLENIRKKAIFIAKEYYQSDLLVTADFEDGSLISKVKFWGTLYIVIAGYGSFRSGLDYLVSDGRKIGEQINNQVIQEIDPNREYLFNAERRAGVPVRIKRIIDDLDYLARNQNNLSPNEISGIISSIKHRLSLALYYCNNSSDKRLIIENLAREAQQNFPNQGIQEFESIYALKRELEYLIEVRENEEFEFIVKRAFLN